MAKLLKCPRCNTKIDVTDLSAGSTVRCTDCGAMVRIPTGSTGVNPAVSAPVAAPPPAEAKPDRGTKSRPKRQTALFRKMSNTKAPGERSPGRVRGEGQSRGASGAKKSNTGAIVAIVAGGLVLVGVLAFVALGGKKDEPSAHSGGSGSEKVSKKKKDKEKEDSSSSKANWSNSFSKPATPAAPGVFQAGAKGMVGDVNINREVQNASLKQQYEGLASAGRVADIVAADGQLFLYAVDGLLSDTESVARSSMQAIHDIIVKRGFAKDVQQYTLLATTNKIMNFEAPASRAEEYGFWSRWWYTRSSQDMVQNWKSDSAPVSFTPSAGGASENPASGAVGVTPAAAGGEWDEIMRGLKAGGGFEQETSPEYPYFQKVKRMGKTAYPKLISYIDNEDPAVGRAAVAALMALTGRDSKLPNESNKAAIKGEWETWAKGQ